MRDPAMFVITWTGMLRSAEVKQMDWKHVKFTERGLMLFVPVSKTDQQGEGAWVFMADQPTSALGVVGVMRRLKELAQEPEKGAVFTARRPKTTEAATQAEPLTTDTMRARLRKTLQQIGVTDVDLFGFHSFRRGGATASHLGQVSERQIMVHGRWRSDCVRKYMYLTAQDEAAWGVADGMHKKNITCT